MKQAYHRKLLLSHPDKTSNHRNFKKDITQPTNTPDIALLKEAFNTLSDPRKRRIYDASFVQVTRRRPAQVVSLEEFVVSRDSTGSGAVYAYLCRCGGSYYISEPDLEADIHVINCETCSEAIWVGYVAVEEDNAPSS